MFNSYVDYRDLIFQDSTVRLSPIEYENQDFKTFLGESFIRSMERMAGIDCMTTGNTSLGTLITANATVVAVLTVFMLLRNLI